MNKTQEIYHQGAALYAQQYDALNFTQVHQSWQPYWPNQGLVLDIGAGSGRDALWLAEQGCQVIAVEPAADLLRIGQIKTAEKVQWLSDSLPDLKACYQLNLQFNTILLSAVWMHLAPSERERAFRKIANLLAPGGHFVLSLRFGEFTDGRVSYPVSVDEIATLAKQFGLVLSHVSALTADSAGRSEVQWQTLVLVLPDDGSASLSRIRHIVLNDNKSSTYKRAQPRPCPPLWRKATSPAVWLSLLWRSRGEWGAFRQKRSLKHFAKQHQSRIRLIPNNIINSSLGNMPAHTLCLQMYRLR